MTPLLPTRHLRRLAALAIVVVLAAGAVPVYRFGVSLPLLRSWLPSRTTASPADSSLVGMTMTSAAAPNREPARGDVTIDGRRQQLIGVRIATVARASLSATVRAPGIVRYDETRQTNVNVKIDGWVRDLDVDFTGQPVRRGQRLFTLYSPELLASQHELLLALRNRDEARASSLADARDYADRLVEAARQRLRLWDLSADEITRIEASRQPLQAIDVVSPASGFVADKQVVRGMRVNAGQTLYTIADINVVWVEVDIYEHDVPLMRLGQLATVTVDAWPGQEFSGRVTYLHPDVNQQTRTAKARLQLPNASSRLKPGMFAHVDLQGPTRSVLTVPADAVLDTGRQQTVFVAEGDGVFTPRPVQTGRRTSDGVEILDGLTEGEQVAAAATFFLDSESQLRAGLQNYLPPASAAADGGATRADQSLAITFRSLVDPPRTGDNVFEATVRDQRGQPVDDADVSVTLFMPAMPTMNMPAMRNETRLPSAGGGVYRGSGQVMMGGRWEATVTVRRGGQPAGSEQFTVVAR